MKQDWNKGNLPLDQDHKDDLMACRTYRDLQGALRDHGWYDTGRGKGGHTVYANDSVIGIITLPSNGKGSEKLPPYMGKNFKALCERAPYIEAAAMSQQTPQQPQQGRHHK